MANVVTSDCGLALLKNLVPGDIFKYNDKYYMLTNTTDRNCYRLYFGVCLHDGEVEHIDPDNYVKVVNELHIIPTKKFVERLSK